MFADIPERKSKWMDVKPKTRDKVINREKRDSKAKSAGSIIVVKAASETPTVENDPLFLRLMVKSLLSKSTCHSIHHSNRLLCFIGDSTFCPYNSGKLKSSLGQRSRNI